MTKPIIRTPRGVIVENDNGTASLIWNPNFVPKWQKRFSEAQVFVDGEVLKKSEKYTPLLTSALIKSGWLGTVIGSGLVQWIVRYARKQYYTARAIGTAMGALRGPAWFERMKAVDGKNIILIAKKIAGTGRR